MAGNKKHGVGFEESDVNVVAVGKFGIGLLLVAIATMGLIFGVFKYFQASEGGMAVSVDPAKVFPHPQLQKTPIPDLKAVRAAEEQVLNTYGWVDQQKGVVRIPIARAMQLVAERGLPVRAATPPGAQGVSMPTESGLGPKVQQPGGPLGEGK